MSKSSITPFLLPSILIVSLASLGISIFQMSQPSPAVVKYVNSQRILKPISKEVNKTIMEIMAPRFKEQNVLNEQINNLEQKKKVKSYLGTAETKKLKEKKQKHEALEKKIYKEYQEQLQRMVQSKFTKINDVIAKIAEKNNYTIRVIQVTQSIQAAIAKKDDITDLVLAKLDITEEKKA